MKNPENPETETQKETDELDEKALDGVSGGAMGRNQLHQSGADVRKLEGVKHMMNDIALPHDILEKH